MCNFKSFGLIAFGAICLRVSVFRRAEQSRLSAARPIFAAGLALLFGIVVAPPRLSATVISQVYGGGGNSDNSYTNDFIEIFNNGSTSQSLNGLSLQYASSVGDFSASNETVLPNFTLHPGQYFLIQEAAGPGGVFALPSPDATGTINLSETSGKVALVNGTIGLNCGGPTLCSPSQLAVIMDLVGYGDANLFEGAGPASSPSSTTVIIRAGGGYTDTNDNAADFAIGSPDPRNTESPLNLPIAATPLPATLPLFAAGIGMVGYLTRRRKRQTIAVLS